MPVSVQALKWRKILSGISTFNMKKVLFLVLFVFLFISCSSQKKSVVMKSFKSGYLKNKWVYSSGHYVVGLDLPSLEPELVVYFETVVDQPYVYDETIAVPVSGKIKKGFEKKIVFLDKTGTVKNVAETVPDVFQILPCGNRLIGASYNMNVQGKTGFSVVDSLTGKTLAQENNLDGLLALTGDPYFLDEGSVLLVTSPAFENEENKIGFWSYDLSDLKLEKLSCFEESLYSKMAYSDSIVWGNLLALFACDMNYLSFYSLPDGKIVQAIDLKREVLAKEKGMTDELKLDYFNLYCVSRNPFLLGNDLGFLCFFCGPEDEERNVSENHFQSIVKIDRESLKVKEVVPLDDSFRFSNPPFETKILYEKVLALRWDNSIAGFDINTGKNVFYKEIELQ